MNEPKDQATGTPSACHCSTVSLIDFQMTVANLSVAEHALREEPYERLPYLAGSLQVAQSQMESLRQEAMELKRTAMDARVAEGLAIKHERERIEGLRVELGRPCVCGCPRSQHPIGGCETRGCDCKDYRQPWRLTGRNALWYVVEAPDGSEFRMADEDSAKRLICKMNFGSGR